ncbi:hypothetical protein DIURU_003484 [Diutina rugosa]|uniref:PH domain-containing protein n=1 Tax=Diutina rugosa TaxID=5481 RepID=A0A642USS4_DIURU|nr:uncharacterized protein DIURU_003484 [Diutina rugosa]KAA8901114.1 hypothetical protein DIURU_003484 [Diutina rugosa]
MTNPDLRGQLRELSGKMLRRDNQANGSDAKDTQDTPPRLSGTSELRSPPMPLLPPQITRPQGFANESKENDIKFAVDLSDTLLKQCRQLREENSRLKKDLKRKVEHDRLVTKELEKLKSDSQFKSEQEQRLQDRAWELESKLNFLQEQMQSQEQSARESSQSHAEELAISDKFQRENDELRKKSSQLEQSLAVLKQQSQIQITQLTAKINDLNDECDQLKLYSSQATLTTPSSPPRVPSNIGEPDELEDFDLVLDTASEVPVPRPDPSNIKMEAETLRANLLNANRTIVRLRQAALKQRQHLQSAPSGPLEQSSPRKARARKSGSFPSFVPPQPKRGLSPSKRNSTITTFEDHENSGEWENFIEDLAPHTVHHESDDDSIGSARSFNYATVTSDASIAYAHTSSSEDDLAEDSRLKQERSLARKASQQRIDTYVEENNRILVSYDDYMSLKERAEVDVVEATRAEGFRVLTEEDYEKLQDEEEMRNRLMAKGLVTIPQTELDRLKAPKSFNDLKRLAEPLGFHIVSSPELESLKNPSYDNLVNYANSKGYHLITTSRFEELQSPSKEQLVELARGLDQVLLSEEEYSDLATPSKSKLEKYARQIDHVLVPKLTLSSLESPSLDVLADHASSLDHTLLANDHYRRLMNPTRDDVVLQAETFHSEVVASSELESLRQRAEHPSEEAVKKHADAYGLITMSKSAYTDMYSKANEPDVEHLRSVATKQGKVLVVEKDFDEMRRDQAELKAKLKSTTTELEQSNVDLESANKQYADLSASLRQQTEEVDRLTMELHQINAEYASIKTTHMRELESLKTSHSNALNTAKKELIDSHKKELATAIERSAAESEAKATARADSKHTEALESTKSQHAKILEQLKNDHSSEMEKSESENTRLKALLQQEGESHEQSRKALDSIKSSHNKVLVDFAALKSAHSEVLESRKNLAANLATRSSEFESRSNQLAEISTKLQTVSSDKEALEKRLTIATAESTKVKEELSDAMSRISDLEKRHDVATQDKAVLERELQDSADQRVVLQRQLNNHLKERDDLIGKLASMDAEKEELSGKLNLKVSENLADKERLALLESQCATITEKLERVTKERDLLDNNLKSIQHDRDLIASKLSSVEELHEKVSSAYDEAKLTHAHELAKANAPKPLDVMTKDLESRGMVVLSADKHRELTQPPSDEIMSSTAKSRDLVIVSNNEWKSQQDEIQQLKQKVSQLLNPSVDEIERYANENGRVVLTSEALERFKNPSEESLASISEARGLVVIAKKKYSILESLAQNPSLSVVQKHASRLGQSLLPNEEVESLRSPSADQVARRAREVGMIALPEKEVTSLRVPSKATLAERARDLGLVCIESDVFQKLKQQADAPSREDIEMKAEAMGLVTVPAHKYDQLKTRAEQPTFDQLEVHARKLHSSVLLPQDEYNRLQESPNAEQLSAYAADLNAVVVPKEKWHFVQSDAYVTSKAAENGNVVLSKSEFENFTRPRSADDIEKDALQLGKILISPDEISKMKEAMESPSLDYLREKLNAMRYEMVSNEDYAKLISPASIEERGLLLVPQAEYDDYKQRANSPTIEQLVTLSSGLGLKAIPQAEFENLIQITTKPTQEQVTKLAQYLNLELVAPEQISQWKQAAESPSWERIEAIALSRDMVIVPKDEFNIPSVDRLKSAASARGMAVVNSADYAATLRRAHTPDLEYLSAKAAAQGMAVVSQEVYDSLVDPPIEDLAKLAEKHHMTLVSQSEFAQSKVQLEKPSLEFLEGKARERGQVLITKEDHQQLVSSRLPTYLESEAKQKGMTLVKIGTIDVLEEREKDLREELDELKSTFETSKLDSQRKLEALSQRLANEEAAKQELVLKLEENQDKARDAATLKAKLDSIEIELAAKEKEVVQKDTYIKKVTKTLEEVQFQLQSNEGMLEVRNKEIQTHKDTSLEHQSVIRDQKNQLETLASEKSALESKIAEFELSKATLEDNLRQMESVSKSVKDNELTITDLTSEKRRLENEAVKLNEQVRTLEKSEQLLNEKLRGLDEKKLNFTQEKSEWEKLKNELQEKVSELEERLATVQLEKESQCVSLVAAQNELQQIKSNRDAKFDELVASHDSKVKEVSDEHESKIRELKNSHDAQISSLSSSHNHSLSELERKYQDQLESSSQEIETLKAQLAAITDKLSASKSQSESGAAEIVKLRAELEERDHVIDELRQQVSKSDAVAHEQERAIKETEALFKDAKAELESRKSESIELQERYEAQVAELSYLKDPKNLAEICQSQGFIAVSKLDHEHLQELAHTPTVDHLSDKAIIHDMTVVSTRELNGLRQQSQQLKDNVLVAKDKYECLTSPSVATLRVEADKHNMRLIDTTELAALKQSANEPLEDRARAVEKKVIPMADYDSLVLRATQPSVQDVNEYAARYGMTVLDVADYKTLKETVDKPITQRASEMGYVALSKDEFEQLSARFDHPSTEYLQKKAKERKLAMVPESEYQHLKSEAERDVKAKAAEKGMVAIPAAELDELHRQAAKDVHARASEENMTVIPQHELDKLRQEAHKNVHQRARDSGLVVLSEAEASKLRTDASKDIHQRARESQMTILDDSELAKLRATADEVAKTQEVLNMSEKQRDNLQKRIDEFTTQMNEYHETLVAIKGEVDQYRNMDLEALAKEHHMVLVSELEAAKIKRASMISSKSIDNFKDANDTFVLSKDELKTSAEQQGFVLLTQDEFAAFHKTEDAEQAKKVDEPANPTLESVAASAKKLGLVTISKSEYQRILRVVDQSHDREAVVQSARKLGLLAVPESAFVPTTVQRAPDLSNVTLIPTTYYNKLSRNDALCIDKVTDDVFRKYAEKRGYTKVSSTGSGPSTPNDTKVTPIMESSPTMQSQAANSKFTPPQPLAKSTRQVSSPSSYGSSKMVCGLLPASDSVRSNLSLTADSVRTTGMLSMATTASFTDKSMMPAITQVMMGEYLQKYYRSWSSSNQRHERYFWVHPYSVTLYWSRENPILNNPNEMKTKAVAIMDVKSVDDNNPYPTGLYHKSIIVYSTNRQIKITCASRQRHNIWYNALRYLIHRNPADLSFDQDEHDEFANPLGDEANETIELLRKRHEFLSDMGERQVQPRQNSIRSPRSPRLISRGNSYRSLA